MAPLTRYMPKSLVVLALLGAAGLAKPVAAQRELYTVRGYVKDTEGALVPEVEITLESPRRITRTDSRGYFRLDSIPEGVRRLRARRIGYLAVNPVIVVPHPGKDTLEIIMLQMPQLLDAIEVKVNRKGIYGVVGDSAYRALPGTLVELLGARLADTTDEQGRFAFEEIKDYRHFVLRVSRVGYYGRLISVDHDKGREFSIFLSEYKQGSFDWANSREAGSALADLATRLAMEPRRTRMTREELTRFGTMALCDIPKVRSIVGRDPSIILRGTTWYRAASLCAWNADQIDLLEWGGDPCKEAWKSIAEVLSVWCGPAPGRIISLYAAPPGRRGGYVVIWPRS
jgi:carboxypeptidase family protein